MPWCPKTLVTLALVFTLSSYATENVDLGVVNEIVARKNNQDVIFCSATILRDEKAAFCRIVSNAHCSPPSSQLFLKFADSWHPVSISKRSARLDLVELKSESTVLSVAINKMCANAPALRTKYLAPPSPELQKSKAISFRATGFVRGQGIETYSRTEDWHKGRFGVSTYSAISTGPNPNEILFEVSHLDTLPGMSGGVLSQYVIGPAGILTRYRPLQQTAYARPLPIVMRWLRDEIIFTDKHNLIEQIAEADFVRRAERSQINVGDGAHANNGDGAHANNGDGAHANNTDNLDVTKLNFDQRSAYATKLLAEGSEGFPIEAEFYKPELIGGILLAVDGQQIDGRDDYQKALLKESQNLITRAANGYPDLEIRRGIIKRLLGNYSSRNQPHHNKARMFMEDAGTTNPWKLVYTSNYSETTLSAPQENTDFTLTMVSSILYFDANVFPDISRKGFAKELKIPTDERLISISFRDENAKTLDVEIRRPHEAASLHLTCDNRHYLKIICSNPLTSDQFSLAYSGSVEKLLNFRFSTISQPSEGFEGRRFINYRSGVLNRKPTR